MLSPERRAQMDAALNGGNVLTPERRRQMDAALGLSEEVPAPERHGLDWAAHTAGITARAGFEGLADFVDFPGQVVNMAQTGVAKLTGVEPLPYSPPAGTMVRKYLDTVDVPKEEGPGERVYGSAVRGASGAGPFGKMAGFSGATGGASAQIAAENGAGGLGQLVAGILGGASPGIVMSAVNKLWRAGVRSYRDLSNPGNLENVGRILRESSNDPEVVMQRLGNAQEHVPGSRPTAAEVSGDNTFIAAQASHERRNPGGAVTDRRQANTAARNAYMDEIAGTPEDVAALKKARDETAGPMREQAFAGYRDDPRLPRGEYTAHAAQVREKAKALSGLDLTLKKNARQLTDWLSESGFQIQSAKSSSGKSTVYTATRPDPVTGQVSTVKFRIGGRPLPSNIASDAVDLARPGGAAQLGTLLAKSTPMKESVNPNFAAGIARRRLKSPEGNLSDVQEGMRHVLTRIVNALNIGDPEYAYALRRDLANDVAEKLATKKGGIPLDDPKKYQRMAAGMTGDILDSLDNQIEKAAPGYQAYMQKYSEMSKPIRQMEELQDIQGSARAVGHDAAGESGMLLGRLNQKLSPDGKAALEKVLTPEQMGRLENLHKDLNRQSVMRSVTPAGSSTPADMQRVNNLIGELIAGNVLSRIPIAGRLARPMLRSFTEGGAEKALNAGLSRAYADPAEARKAMQAALEALQREPLPAQFKKDALKAILGASIGSLPPKQAQQIME